MSRRRRATLIVTVDIDPVEGAFDDDNVRRDVLAVLQYAIPHYHPDVVRES